MVELSTFDNRDYDPGANRIVRLLWYVVNALLFDSWIHLGSRFKMTVLRAFGAKVGAGVVIKPRVNIKQPWRLQIGAYSWIGEGVWIDNLAEIDIGSNVCISQGAYLFTGNHDFTDPAFGLTIKRIKVSDGAWIGAQSTVCPGVVVGKQSVLAACSTLSEDSEPDGIYRGNPAKRIKIRTIAAN